LFKILEKEALSKEINSLLSFYEPFPHPLPLKAKGRGVMNYFTTIYALPLLFKRAER